MHNWRALAHYFFAAPWRDYMWWLGTLALTVLVVARARPRTGGDRIAGGAWPAILIAMMLATPHLHSHDLSLLLAPAAFLLKSAGPTVPPLWCLALVIVGVLPLVNTVAYPHLPPLVPLVLLLFLAVDSRRVRLSAADHAA
jgi:hypothetical protein